MVLSIVLLRTASTVCVNCRNDTVDTIKSWLDMCTECSLLVCLLRLDTDSLKGLELHRAYHHEKRYLLDDHHRRLQS